MTISLLLVFCRSDQLKMHLKSHDNNIKQLPCPVCNQTFSFLGPLTAHMMLHKMSKITDSVASTGFPQLTEVLCPQCGDKCYSMEELQAHLQTHNEEMAMAQDKTVMSCPYCAEMFVEVEVLEMHIEQTHTIESINKCPICAMCFLDNEDLTLHLKSHETAAILKDAKMASFRQKKGQHHSDVKQMEDESLKLDCPYCIRKGFSTLGMLNVHIRTMHTGVTDHLFSCHICNIGFASSGKLTEHMQKDHPGLVIDQEELEIKFPCDYCTLEFNSVDSLRHHKVKIHKITDTIPKPVDVVYCSQCTMSFPHIYALAEHMHNVHGYNNNKSSPLGSPTKSQSPNSKSSPEALCHPGRDAKHLSLGSAQNETYICDHCNSTYHSLNSYQVHLKKHIDLSKYMCTECQAEFTSEEQLENHMFVHYLVLVTQYGCTSCLKLFNKPDELQKHLIDIHAHHLYRCSLCKEVFDSKVNIQVHFAIKHSNECKLYKCSHCGSVFRSEMEWQLHVRVYHLGISKPYRCLFCKDSFTSETELQSHINTHKKQFTCPLCDEAFHVEYLLDKHMQTNHSPEGTTKVNNTVIKTEPGVSILDGLQYSATSMSSPSMTKANSSCKTSSSGRRSPKALTATPPTQCGNGVLNLKNGDLVHKCEICDVIFSDEGTLQKHRVHDHSMSPEMQLVIQKSEQAKATQRALLNASAKTNHHGNSEKFSQLCVYCNQTFKTKGELEKHMKTHITPSNQKCNICDEIFPSASILAEHKLTHCKVVKGNTCVMCKIPMKSEEQFYNHSQQHGFQGTNMQCVVCRQTLASMLELQMHARHHFQNPSDCYTCCVCTKSFSSKENLISKLNTSGRTYYVCKPCYHGEVPSALDHRCPQCNIKFENKMQMEMHVLQHQKTFQCIKCQQSFATEYEIQLHVATHVMQEGNIHECKICNKIFESPAKLQCHLIEHTFEKTEMKCYICGLMFTQASSIQVHVLEHGVGARQYSCTQCPQKFFFSAELQNHMYSHGPLSCVSVSPNQDYYCPDCPKMFASLSQLKSHHKLHKKDAALQCSLCMESFCNMIELQQHFFIVHSGLDFDKGMAALTTPSLSPKKPVQCTECGKEFPSVNSLQGHMRVHSSSYKGRTNASTVNSNAHPSVSNGNSNSASDDHPFLMVTKHCCSECGKELSSAKNLAYHMRVHTGEKPYECPVCHKYFSRKENRRSHMKIHAGIKPYSCPVCNRSFSRRCHVKEHLKVHFTQPNIQSCNDCEETFTHMRHLRRHITTAHNKNPDYVCKLCSQVFDSSKTLRSHFYQIHNVQDDVMETLSVSSDDGTKVAYLETEDTSDSLSFNSDSALHNGLESVDSNEQNSTSNGLELDQNHLGIVPKIEGNVAMVTTPEQVTVN
ncbi:hypothetical protein LSH36_323g03140 [Paralvinella palmiformis]|uniref:C2H2-type domain-containing protein n=1 Tax=Paralvinella palmiformis TaxID=53620 RepID=A0AAD9JH10_9ANNE|nr:hypothetical protein LSH36_323g03140 [Paralvinella palmiformis]